MIIRRRPSVPGSNLRPVRGLGWGSGQRGEKGTESSSHDHAAGQGECEGSTSDMHVPGAYTTLDPHVATPKHLVNSLFASSLESRCTIIQG